MAQASERSDKLASFTGFRIYDPDRVTTVTAIDGKTGNSIELSYTSAKIIGNGSFGVVFQAKMVSTQQPIAIKKVLQDKRFKVRPHPTRLLARVLAPSRMRSGVGGRYALVP